MATTQYLENQGQLTAAIVGATTSATAVPDANTNPWLAKNSARIRAYFAYSGTVTSCNVCLWIKDRGSGAWHRGACTDDVDPLAPGGASPVNEVRDFTPGIMQEFTFQVRAIAGGGSVAVRGQTVRNDI